MRAEWAKCGNQFSTHYIEVNFFSHPTIPLESKEYGSDVKDLCQKVLAMHLQAGTFPYIFLLLLKPPQ